MKKRKMMWDPWTESAAVPRRRLPLAVVPQAHVPKYLTPVNSDGKPFEIWKGSLEISDTSRENVDTPLWSRETKKHKQTKKTGYK